jgi:glycosyltransferase involved in cell wall biosynthesis
VSEDIAADVRDTLPLPISMIPNGVDVDGMRWTGERDAIIVMGGIGPWKGEATALRAWAALERSTRGTTTLDIIGVQPLERRQALLALGAELGVAESVSVRGVISRNEFLRAVADGRAAVSCSEFESFGLPVAEALMMGAPVICSSLPAHVELLTRASAGTCFRAGDAHALADHLRRLLSGHTPPRCEVPPSGWTWEARAREHVDAFLRYGPYVRH